MHFGHQTSLVSFALSARVTRNYQQAERKMGHSQRKRVVEVPWPPGVAFPRATEFYQQFRSVRTCFRSRRRRELRRDDLGVQSAAGATSASSVEQSTRDLSH